MIRRFAYAVVMLIVLALAVSCTTFGDYPKELKGVNADITVVVNDPGPVQLVNDQTLFDMAFWAMTYFDYLKEKVEAVSVDEFRNMLGFTHAKALAEFPQAFTVGATLTAADVPTVPVLPKGKMRNGYNYWDFTAFKAKITTRYVFFIDSESWKFNAGPKDKQDPEQIEVLGSAELILGYYIMDMQDGKILWYGRSNGLSLVEDDKALDRNDLFSYYTKATVACADGFSAALRKLIK